MLQQGCVRMTLPLTLPVTLWALFPAPIMGPGWSQCPGVSQPRAQVLGEALGSVLLLGQVPLWPLSPTCHMREEGSLDWHLLA